MFFAIFSLSVARPSAQLRSFPRKLVYHPPSMDQSTLPLGSTRGDALELVVCEGTSIRRFPLEGEITIGRDADATITLASRAASRLHARIRGGATPTIEHLGSVNPTIVNGKRLASGDVVALDHHAVIVIAEAQVVVRRTSAPEAPVKSVPERSMDHVWKLVELAAPSELSILVLGETGVGKEVVARRIHELSPRAAKPMLAINCAALHESTLESELFGHEKGAFTGAVATKPGLLESAQGSTVLLDEVGELPLAVQAKLLRALDAREVVRLGAVKPRAIDIRVIAATHRDLSTMVDEKTFRDDLFFRLDGLTIHVPPLRNRREEIVPLARQFARPKSIDADAEATLLAYEWPGNVRELSKVIERAVVLAGAGNIGTGHLQFKRAAATKEKAVTTDFRAERDRAERDAIEKALDQCGGNQTRAAEVLGISRRTLVDRIGKYGIKRGTRE